MSIRNAQLFDNALIMHRKLREGLIGISNIYKTYNQENTNKSDIYGFQHNLLYRATSALVHYKFLIQAIRDTENEYSKINRPDDENSVFKKSNLENIYYNEVCSLFDSLVYHTYSSFDYLALMVKFIYSKNKKMRQFKWTELFKECKGPKKSDFRSFQIASSVIKCDNNYLNKLHTYRSNLIHKILDLRTFSIRHDPINETFTFEISPLDRDAIFLFKCTNRILTEGTKITIDKLAYCLLEKMYDTLYELLESIYIDIVTDLQSETSMLNLNNNRLDFAVLYHNPDGSTIELHKRQWADYLSITPNRMD